MSLAAELDIPGSGAVFTFGRSQFADNEPSHFFIKNDPVVYIACGGGHTAVICEQGRVFAFGANSKGQLGLGHTADVQRPACLKWLKPRRVRQLACGRAYTLFLTDNNQLYGCGDNSSGQLGTGTSDGSDEEGQEQQLVPQFAAVGEAGTQGPQLVQVAAGAEHSVVLTDDGSVFACGSNSRGQLGLGPEVQSCAAFRQVPLCKNVKFIACGQHHTIFITDSGEAYACGGNEQQRLGGGDPGTRVFSPQPILGAPGLLGAAAGAEHSLLLAADGAVLGLGSNARGQLGLGAELSHADTPTTLPADLFPDERIVQVACGDTHSAFLTEKGNLYTCGDSLHHKLCIDIPEDVANNNTDATETSSVTCLPKLVTILEGFHIGGVACGSEHTILTAKKIISNENANAETVKGLSVLELPPLQKIPASMMNRNETSPEKSEEPPKLSAGADSGGGEESAEKTTSSNSPADKQSMNSLEPNVSGSHILDINDLPPSAPSNLLAAEDVENNSKAFETTVSGVDPNISPVRQKVSLVRQQSVMKHVEETFPAEDVAIVKLETVPETITEIENITSDAATTMENIEIPPEVNLLKVPEALQHSPDMSTKSDVSQKTVKSSTCSQKSENETIVCHSDKSSPQQTKLSKTQAVIPILRADETVAGVNQLISDEADIAQSKMTKSIDGEGKISKFFNGSCMGKGKVLSSIDLKESGETIEVDTSMPVGDQTNSRTCVIL